ncbi:MAG: hypothetical protein NWF13_06255 [Candidatus Bathyarchaeota archaeon]|nr:hypothetical protein [Candidatus Bathyarchaeota archaeon]
MELSRVDEILISVSILSFQYERLVRAFLKGTSFDVYPVHPYLDKPPFDSRPHEEVSSTLPCLDLDQTTSSFSLENGMAGRVLRSEPISIDIIACKKPNGALVTRTFSRMVALMSTFF